MDLQTRLMLFVPLTGPHVADGSVQHFEDIPVRVVVDAQIAKEEMSLATANGDPLLITNDSEVDHCDGDDRHWRVMALDVHSFRQRHRAGCHSTRLSPITTRSGPVLIFIAHRQGGSRTDLDAQLVWQVRNLRHGIHAARNEVQGRYRQSVLNSHWIRARIVAGVT